MKTLIKGDVKRKLRPITMNRVESLKDKELIAKTPKRKVPKSNIKFCMDEDPPS